MQDILGAVEGEPRTLPRYGLRRGGQDFGISGTLPGELARARDLAGPSVRMLAARSAALPARPLSIHRTDMMMGKG